MAEYYEETNDLAKALHYLKRYFSLYEELVNEQSINSLTDLRLQYETEKKEQEIVLLKKEGEEALLKERLRISRDLHDDMGATLSSISVYGEAVKQRIKQSRMEEAESLLDRISEDARDMVSTIGDMIWMLSPQNDCTEKLTERIYSYAIHTFAARDIQLKFDCADAVKNMNSTIEQRKNIYLLVKEAINNAAKYSEAEEVRIEFQKSESHLAICIQDNGKGFDIAIAESSPRAGNGLKNMKQRAALLQAQLNIESKALQGTSICFSAPING